MQLYNDFQKEQNVKSKYASIFQFFKGQFTFAILVKNTPLFLEQVENKILD
jgi:hypothetical protein